MDSMLKMVDIDCGPILFTTDSFSSEIAQDSSSLSSHQWQELESLFHCWQLILLLFRSKSSHSFDHAIALQAGITAISMKPYRYSHHQKDEMQRLVAEIWRLGLFSLILVLFQALFWFVKRMVVGISL